MSEVAKGIAIAAALVGASFLGPIAGTAFAAFLFNAGLSVGLSVLAQQLDKPGGAKVRPSGTIQQAATTGENASAGFLVGRWATRGHLVYQGSLDAPDGVPNEWLTRVIELSDLPGLSLRRVSVGGEWLTLLDNGDYFGTEATNARFVLGSDDNHLFVRFYDGTQTTADPYLVGSYGSAENPWTADMIGAGIAYAIVTYKSNPGMWQGNIEPLFELGGIPLYDPRKDSTVGGTGAHRWGTPATYEQTENPMVIAYNVARGIALPGGQVYGGDLGPDSLPVANWSAAMNVCDVDIGGRAQYTFGTEILVADMEPADVIEACLAACQGQISEMGGVFRVQVGAPAVASYNFTDGDMSADDPASFAPIKGLASRYNGITATYTDPGKLWELAAPAPLYNATWEAEDGNRRLVADLQLAGVFNASQAVQIQTAMIADERRQRQHQIVLPPDALQIQVLDTVSWTSVENGYDAKLFEVVSLEQRPDSLFVAVTLRERDPTDYDWSAAQDVPDLPLVLQIPAPPPRTMTGWAVAGVAIPDADGVARRPAIRLSWTAAAMTDIDLMQWEVRLADLDVVASGTAHVRDGTVTITGPILPGGAYEARGRPVAVQRSAWTAWLGAVAPGASLQLIDFDAFVQSEIDKGQAALTLAADNLAIALAAAQTVQNNLDVAAGGLTTDLADKIALLDGSVTDILDSIDAVEVTLAQAIVDGDTATLSTVANQYVANATLTSATAALRTDLESQITNGDAATLATVASTYLTDVTEDTAFTSLRDTVTATSTGLVDRLASVESTYVAQTDLDNAQAAQNTLLRAEFDTDIGSVQSQITDIRAVSGTAAGSALATSLQTLTSEVVTGGGTTLKAQVTNQATTLAEQNGFLQAFAGLTVQTGTGGAIAGFKATSFSDPDGSSGATLELLGDVIVPGTLAAESLLIGLGRNAIATVFPAVHGLTGWEFFGGGADTYFESHPTWETYSHPQEGTFQIAQYNNNALTFSWAQYRGISSPSGDVAIGYPVSPGEHVEFSARVSTHRCGGQVEVLFLDSTRTEVAGRLFGNFIDDTPSSSTNLRQWSLSSVVGPVPAGAAYAVPRVLKVGTYAPHAASFLFFAHPMMATTLEGRQPTPFSAPASTYIGPQGIATNAITADKITAETVRAKVAQFGNTSTVGLVADNAIIYDASITSAKIVDAAVDTLKIAGNAVTVPAFSTGIYVAEVDVTLSVPSFVMAIATFTQGNGKNNHVWRLYIAGVQIQIDLPESGTLGAMSGGRYLAAGTHRVYISCDSLFGDGKCGIVAMAAMR